MYTALIGTLAVIDVGSWNVVAQCAEPFSSWIIISLVSLVLTLLMAIVCVCCVQLWCVYEHFTYLLIYEYYLWTIKAILWAMISFFRRSRDWND